MRKSYTTHYAFKPRIIVPKHPSRYLTKISFVPIKGNRILLFTNYLEPTGYLHLSIHEIRSDHRVGPALWSFNDRVDNHFENVGHFEDYRLELTKLTKNTLRITVVAYFDDHWKLFDISTTEADALDNFPLIESGRIDFDRMLDFHWTSAGLSEFFAVVLNLL